MVTIGDDIDSVVSLFDGLEVDEQGRVDETAQSRQGQNEASLLNAINDLAQVATAVLQKAHQIKRILEKGHSFNDNDIQEICLLRGHVKRLPRAAHTLVDATEQSIIRTVTSLGGHRTTYETSLLSHFRRNIRSIGQGILENTPDCVGVLWKIAEECFNQALDKSGRLYVNSLDTTTDETCKCLEDTGSSTDEYGKICSICARHDEYSSEDKKRRQWVDFWARTLRNCPGGPTLFYPPASSIAKSLSWPFSDVPRYLFRVFDKNSSGINDGNIVASTMKEFDKSKRSKTDILSLSAREATSMLYNHLNKGQFNGVRSDNLMSWSSSFLFVIQYAIWRSSKSGLSPANIQICVVDTRKFPAGQFIHDIKLLQLYRNTIGFSSYMKRTFFHFRLNRSEYQNGEYLSQGALTHGGRSCIFSLEDLVQAGLYDLYRPFENVQARSQWTNRVRDLRCDWSPAQRTLHFEIDFALNIARECFENFDEADIALMILSFKNRRLETAVHEDALNGVSGYEPIEVQRYVRAQKALQEYRQNSGPCHRDHYAPSHDTCALQAIFGCYRVYA